MQRPQFVLIGLSIRQAGTGLRPRTWDLSRTTRCGFFRCARGQNLGMASSGRPEIYYASELLGSGVVVAFGMTAVRLPSATVGSFTSHQIAVLAMVAAVLSAIATVHREYRLYGGRPVAVPAQYVAVPVSVDVGPVPATARAERTGSAPTGEPERAPRRSAIRAAFMSRPFIRSDASVQTIST